LKELTNGIRPAPAGRHVDIVTGSGKIIGKLNTAEVI
jgi:hypothetical protein